MLGNWSITHEVYNEILSCLEEGKTILELGSGKATELLSKRYNIYSIEQNIKYVGANNKKENYIYAPIKDGWYDLDFNKLPKKYDLLLIDGPIGSNRKNIIPHLEKFNIKDTIIIVDDINRQEDMSIAVKISIITGRAYKVIGNNQKITAVFQ